MNIPTNRFLFLFLLIFVTLINLRYFSPFFYPQHDTLYVFEIFYFFYNEFFFHYIIPQWMPYGAYGIPSAAYQITSLSPCDYFIFLIGKIFSIKDVLLLFKMSTLLKQFIFLTGLFNLCKLFFNRKSVIAFVCLSAFCSLDWSYQVFWNLKIYDYLPWVLYFWVLFIKHQKPCFFWMSGILLILWAWGGLCYFIPLWLSLGIILSLVIFIYDKKIYNIWLKKSPDFILMCFFIIFLGIYLSFLFNSFELIKNTERPENLSNSLEVFLHHARNPSYDDIVSWFTTGWPIFSHIGLQRDNTVYPGLSCVFFFLWASIFVRQKFFLSILAGVFMLIFLSFGGTIATLLYYFPGMSYFRHVGLVLPLAKILIALGAGFGLANFLEVSWSTRAKRFSLILIVLALLMASSLQARSSVLEVCKLSHWFDFFTNFDISQTHVRFGAYYLVCLIFFITSTILAIIYQNKKAKMFAYFEKTFLFLLFLIVCFDITSFQNALSQITPKIDPEHSFSLKATEVHKLKFVPQRSDHPSNEHQRLSLILNNQTINPYSARYNDTFWNFCQMDPAPSVELIKTTLLNSYVYQLKNASLPRGLAYDQLFGINYPKLRLLQETIFLNRNNQEIAARIEVTKFTANELLMNVNIQQQKGAWLVYADAYHPGWKGYVDGVKQTVYRANIAFKAIFVPTGYHQIHFVFFNGMMTILSYLLAGIGIVTSLLFLWLIIAILLNSFDLEIFCNKFWKK